MIEIKIREVKDAWIYDIQGINKGGGEGAKEKTKEYLLLEIIGEAILGHKIEIKRKWKNLEV